jgi:UDP-glucose 4-epimerase
VRDVVGDVPIVHVEGRAADLRGANISGGRAYEELGWEPTTTFADGVRSYVDWVIATEDTPSASTAAMTDGTAATVLRQESAEL